MTFRGFRLSLPIVVSILCLNLLVPAGKAQDPGPQTRVTETKPTNVQKIPPEAFTDQELATLAQRAENPDDKVVGGSLSNQELTYIVIALAAAVLVLIIVAA